MGTDRVEHYRGPCRCGQGQVIEWDCTPDHPYPTGIRWLEAEIACPPCNQEYALVDQDGGVYDVRRSLLDERTTGALSDYQ